jgi:hypothetical protein
LIYQWVQANDTVLDCGCGRGGDFLKWREAKVRLFAIDPDEESLKEAESRAKDMDFNVFFLGQGSILQAAFAGPYNVVCYNFSLHYIFENEKTFENSVKALGCAVRDDGFLIGIVPDRLRAENMADRRGQYKDRLGNAFYIFQCGRKLMVQLVDGPFYADGGREEPLLDPKTLVHALKNVGLELLTWEPMLPEPNGLISDLYSKFVFKKVSSDSTNR